MLISTRERGGRGEGGESGERRAKSEERSEWKRPESTWCSLGSVTFNGGKVIRRIILPLPVPPTATTFRTFKPPCHPALLLIRHGHVLFFVWRNKTPPSPPPARASSNETPSRGEEIYHYRSLGIFKVSKVVTPVQWTACPRAEIQSLQSILRKMNSKRVPLMNRVKARLDHFAFWTESSGRRIRLARSPLSYIASMFASW